MKNIKKIMWGLLALVVVAARTATHAATVTDNGTIDTTIDPAAVDYDIDSTAVTTHSTTAKIIVNDQSGNGSGGAVTFSGNTWAPVEVQIGTVKVGTGGSHLTQATTVQSGGILEITDNTAGCIAGPVVVQNGGAIQVDAGKTVPADGTNDATNGIYDQFAGTDNIIIHNGAKIILGNGSTWGKNVNVTS